MGMLEAAQCLSVAVMDVTGVSAVWGVFHSWGLPWFQPGDGHTWLKCFQSYAHRWQSISLDLPARHPLAEGCSWCSDVMGSVESPESPGLAAHHLPGGFRLGRGELWLLFVVVGSLIPACSASPAAEDCSSSPAVSSTLPTPVAWDARGEWDHSPMKTSPKPWAWRNFESLSVALSWVGSFMLYHIFVERAQEGRAQILLGTSELR